MTTHDTVPAVPAAADTDPSGAAVPGVEAAATETTAAVTGARASGVTAAASATEAEVGAPEIIDPDPVGSAASDAARGSRRGLVDRRWFRVTVGAVLPAALLVAWQVVATGGTIPSSRLPSPQMVWDAGADLVDRGDLGDYVAISTQRVLTGFAFGAGIGLLLGAVVGLSRLFEALLSPLLGALRAVPSLAWVPLLILWFKIGEESKIILITIGAFFPMYTIVSAALRHVDRHLLEAGRAFGYHGVPLFAVVQLPAVIPSVISGFRLALAQAWLFLVAAELIAASEGLGFLLSESGNNGRIDRLFLAIVVLALLGKATDSVLSVCERLAARRWG